MFSTEFVVRFGRARQRRKAWPFISSVTGIRRGRRQSPGCSSTPVGTWTHGPRDSLISLSVISPDWPGGTRALRWFINDLSLWGQFASLGEFQQAFVGLLV